MRFSPASKDYAWLSFRSLRRSIYLKAHLYGNAVTADLWAGISEASGNDVAGFMLNWTNKIGFPVITVEETSEGLKLTQNRFLATGDPTVRFRLARW